MRRFLATAAVAVAVAAGAAGLGCSHGSAPVCQGDADCEPGQRCVASAGVCVGFETPLLPAPDAGTDGPAGDAPAAGDAAGGAG